ncbi:carboxypeptidase-like regulatory domain-containing protein [Urechidicola croceus]|uniref:TonB-dependent receptor n=1 Tax=Urechidicola croceus TaxID=1850246 RepID=A0A1D8P8U6_9FLAO|nr:carboxypeptidase-like regulatory domain-containing protein [Urechidicola croceus]AOW20988.1 TonB-dependent receptor [Urechidicola croceus]
MRKFIISLLFGLTLVFTSNAQSLSTVKGNVSDSYSTEPLNGVTVTVLGTTIEQLTDEKGNFVLQNVPTGNQLIQVKLIGYESQNFPISVVDGEEIDLGSILLYEEILEQNDLSIISLSTEELNDDEGGADNTVGLLQSSKDVFLSTASYEFSSTFFRPRGYNSENGKLLINGIEMNKIYNGRPQWSNWGGLNDVMRNQIVSNGLAPSEYTFGDIAGSNNVVMRASEYSEGGRVSYAASNRSYTGRVMASYSSGVREDGLAFSILASRRFGNEGYNDATLYDANSIFAAIEKRFNDKHSLNLTAFYTPNRRGKSSPNTQEVIDLKGNQYNSFWGYQDDKKRNSRMREIEEPVIMLNHYWDINDVTTLNTNVAYQAGKIGNSRLNYDVNNPDPTYYRKLPSYFLRFDDALDYEGAYLAQEKFVNDGQIDWTAMYQANLTNGRAVYALYEDRNDDKQFTANTIFRTELNDNIDLNAAATYRKLKSKNFASMLDLLGGNGYLDIDTFSDLGSPEAQNNLQDPNRLVQEGEKFKYNYEIDANIIDAFAQAQFQYNKVDFYLAGQISKTDYQRNGLYENGRFQGNRSLGKSDKIDFTNFSAKGGLTYKISGRHLLDFNAGYLTKAPTIRNSFSNSRENNDIVVGLTDEKVTSFDASYILRTPMVKARLTGYYTMFEDATEISFFYADGISGTNDSQGFLQEVLTGINKRNIGLEFGIEAQVTSTIKLKGAAAIGDYIYDNNPNLYVASDDFNQDINGGRIDYGEASLKNYHVSGGPQRAYSAGFEYRDPDYWWFGATTNYFSNGYVDVAPITRTSNFSSDPVDGQVFTDYDPVLARELLAQEQFDDYFLVNAVGGKSWRIDDYYIGFFATVNNILNTKYKTGGFEQSRNANFRTLRDDQAREKPVFGSKYFNGFGTTYYLNVYFRF